MGLFDKIRKNRTQSEMNNNQPTASTSNAERNKIIQAMYYGNEEKRQEVLSEFSTCLKSVPAALRMDIASEIYIRIFISCKMPEAPSEIKENICYRFANIPKDEVLAFAEMTLDYIYYNDPESRKKADFLESMYQYVNEKAKDNVAIQDLYISDPEYGLVLSKPVFVNGFGKDKQYLSHLAGKNGESLSFERQGSVGIEGISGLIDIYTAFLPSNEVYGEIFICLYGTRTAAYAPAGYTYIN